MRVVISFPYSSIYDNTPQLSSRVTDYGKIYDDLYACIYQGKAPYVKAEEVVAVLNIAEEAEKAAGN